MKKRETKKRETHSIKQLYKKDLLVELDYVDSLFDLRLFVTKDGRRRGLWVWLEDATEIRAKQDARYFEEGLADFVRELAKLNPKSKLYRWEVGMLLRLHFDLFFGERTRPVGLRLSWKRVKKLAEGLLRGHASEKKKTEEDW